MEVLFVHPNFPGQFRRVAAALAQMPGYHVVGMGDESWMQDVDPLEGVPVIKYPAPDSSSDETHPFVRPFDEAVRRGQQVVRSLTEHKKRGFEPDVIFAHPGWGDALFLRDFFPGAKVLGLFEYFYHARGSDVGFDPEFPSNLDDVFRLRMLNATQLMALESCHAGFSPTAWQRDQFPEVWRSRLSLLHEGVDTAIAAPDPTATVTLPDGTAIKAGDEVLTFASRSLEPYRGFHVFMRALPQILAARPNCRVLVMGNDDTSYGPKPGGETTWKAKYLGELGNRLDADRVHFLGKLRYEDYIKVLQVSRLHVYLTYPFILSWSMLEAMSAGCLVLGSATPPVEEVIAHGQNGLLFPFRSEEALAGAAIEALEKPERFDALRQRARETILRHYDFATVALPGYLKLLDS